MHRLRKEYRLARENTTVRTVIVTITGIALGLGLLFWSNNSTFWENQKSWQGVVRDLGSLFIVSVGVAAIWELSAKRSFVEELLSRANISEDVQKSGLTQIVYDPHQIDWEKLFDRATEVDLLFAYAKNWLGTHEARLQQLAKRKDVTFRVILPDPDNQRILEELAIRFNKTPQGIKDRILGAKQDILDLKPSLPNTGCTLDMWHTTITPVFTMYRFDKTIVLTMYSHREKVDVPHMVVVRGGYLYDYAFKQFEALLNQKPDITRIVS